MADHAGHHDHHAAAAAAAVATTAATVVKNVTEAVSGLLATVTQFGVAPIGSLGHTFDELAEIDQKIALPRR